MATPTDDELNAAADDLEKDALAIAKEATVQVTTDSFLDHLEAIGLQLLDTGEKIALPLLEQAAIAAIQGALERRK